MAKLSPYDMRDPDFIEDTRPPPLLFHYTDAAGFFQIVESGVRLHATHYRFLNDIGELRFGREVVHDILTELRELVGADVRDAAEARIDAMIGEGSYVACLSEQASVLSQWRAYAKNGAGYCLGLRAPSRLMGGSNYDSFYFNHLVRCLYGAAEVRDHIDSRFRRKLSRAESAKGTDEYEDRLASQLVDVAWRAIHVAKHEHFREEYEWRFIVGGSAVAPQYRISPRGLVPFLATDALTLEEVWIGPAVCPSPDVAKETAIGFLGSRKIEAAVKVWASPFVATL